MATESRHQLVFCAPAATEYPGRAVCARKRCVSRRATTGGRDGKESRQSNRDSALDTAKPPQFQDKTSNCVGGPGLPALARRAAARGRHSSIPSSAPSDAPAVVDGARREEGPPASRRTVRGTGRRGPARPDPLPDPPASLRGGGPGRRRLPTSGSLPTGGIERTCDSKRSTVSGCNPNAILNGSAPAVNTTATSAAK